MHPMNLLADVRVPSEMALRTVSLSGLLEITMRQVVFCWLLTSIFANDASAAEPISGETRDFFETRIRPVLVDQCYSCHNSTKQADGDLRLDSRDGVLKGGEKGPIIVPRRPQESRLLAILRHEVPDLKMPQSGARLDDRTIADFEKWIALGAPDPRDTPPSADELAKATSWESIVSRRKLWWSLRPVVAPEIPSPAGSAWSDHPVDRLILAKLREQQLEPNDRATAPVLVRRTFLALIGLPPTPDEIEHWVPCVDQPDGLAQLVDHLLNSPHFGERWARHWMDWIRYCDSHGSEGDPVLENGWQYRDYLIRALNADLPYDQLVREHIAGDLLDQPRVNTTLAINESLIATAHWRMVFHGFSPTDALDEKVRFIDDQINAFTKAFMGMTVSCARCHDHKFDAISQKDYYALFGILSAGRPGRSAIDLPSKQETNSARLKHLKPQIRSAIADDWLGQVPLVREQLLATDGPWKKTENPRQLLHAWMQLQSDLGKGLSFEAAWKQRVAAWTEERDRRNQSRQANSLKRWSFARQNDFETWTRTGLGLAEATPSPAGEFAVSSTGDAMLTGIYPSGVYSHLVSDKHAARLTSRDLKLDGEYNVYIRALGENSNSRYVVYDYPRDGTIYPVAGLNNEWRWNRLDMSYWSGDTVHFELSGRADAPLMATNDPRSWFGVRDVVVLKKADPPPHDSIEFLDPWFEIASDHTPQTLNDAADQFTIALSEAIRGWSRGIVRDSQALLLDASLKQGLLSNHLNRSGNSRGSELADKAAQLIAEYRRLEAEIPVPTRTPTLEESPERVQHLYIRGNHKQPGELIPFGFLSALNPQPYDGNRSARLQLADDLLRPDNPLTRRVIVNRLWHHLFGRGIVGTPDNFGKLGHAPTHPELLDHLAAKFQKEGGSLKQMIRYLITSKTWQLSSKPSELATLRDPDNNWRSHFNVKRLEAEAIRDSLLLVSGRLSPDLYGPPVDGGSTRRSVYMRVQRNSLDPFLRSFDFPEPFTSVGRRDVTNVPAQSLTMMNDERIWSQAAAWADRVTADLSISDSARIQGMFLSAFGRPATQDDVRQFQAYLKQVVEQQSETMRQIAVLRQQIDDRQSAINTMIAAVRSKLLGEDAVNFNRQNQRGPLPIASWEFRTDLNDRAGRLHLELHQGARLDKGAISTNQGGFALSAPLTNSISAKTLEAWVQLDSLDQQGGGVMTIQSRGGEIFDAIVFAEHSPRQWMAGSNNFVRTSPFNGPAETEAAGRPVHLAIAYHPDGMIAAYRDGQPYGVPYKSSGPVEFKAGESNIGFGLRHHPPGGNKMLAAQIVMANLYDRALSAEEISVTSQARGPILTETQLLAALSADQRQQLTDLKQQISGLRRQIEILEPSQGGEGNQNPWTELARAMFAFKEFLFVK